MQSSSDDDSNLGVYSSLPLFPSVPSKCTSKKKKKRLTIPSGQVPPFIRTPHLCSRDKKCCRICNWLHNVKKILFSCSQCCLSATTAVFNVPVGLGRLQQSVSLKLDGEHRWPRSLLWLAVKKKQKTATAKETQSLPAELHPVTSITSVLADVRNFAAALLSILRLAVFRGS